MIPFTPHTITITRRVSGVDDNGEPNESRSTVASNIKGLVAPNGYRPNEIGQATVGGYSAYLPGVTDVQIDDEITWTDGTHTESMLVTIDPQFWPDPMNPSAFHHTEAIGRLVV